MTLPYFPMYPTDFEAKTSHLTLEEDGAYNRLMRIMWMTPGCSIPDDDAWIMRRMRVDEETFYRVVAPIISEFLRRSGGRVFSSRLREEFEKADETYKKRSSAGKKGGRPKAVENKQKDVKPGLSRVKAGPKQPEPEPEPDILKKEAIASKEKKPITRSVQLPTGWVPNSDNENYAREKGLSDHEIRNEGEKFKDYHAARGSTFKDWDAAWRTWIRNAQQFAASRGGPQPSRSNPSSGQQLTGLAGAAMRSAARRSQGV